MRAPHPFMVAGIALTVAIVSLLTIPVPNGTNMAGYLAGYLVTPILLATAYALWYRRRRRLQ